MDKKPKLHLLLTNSFQERVSWVASTSAPATAHGRLSQVERPENPVNRFFGRSEYQTSINWSIVSIYVTMLSPSQPWAVDPEANRQTARFLVRKSEGREEQGCHEEQTGELILLKINVIIMWSSKQYEMHLETNWWIGYFTKTPFLEYKWEFVCWFLDNV